MVRFDLETSNTIFETLKHWDAYLKAEKIDIPELLREAETEHKEPNNSPLTPHTVDKSATKSELSQAFKPNKSDIKCDPAAKSSKSQHMRGPSR